MAKKVKIIKKTDFSHYMTDYCLVCLTGSQKEFVFVLQSQRVVIGRSKDADLQIDDTKMSREHGELTLVNQNWYITDLKSQNGIVVNKEKIKQKQLQNNDKIILGQTVLKFLVPQRSQESQEFQKEKNDESLPLTFDENIIIEERVKKSSASSLNKPPRKNSTLILILVIAILALLFWEPDSSMEKDSTKKRKQDPFNQPSPALDYPQMNRNITTSRTDEVDRKLEAIFQRGLRELREKNYYRAINEFNLALVLSPGNAQGDFYLRRAKEELNREIEALSLKALRDVEALKYKSAIVSYCAIMRLLYKSPNDKRYLNAQDQKNNLEDKLGIKDHETFCGSK